MIASHSTEATKASGVQVERVSITDPSCEEKMEVAARSGDEALKIMHTNFEPYTEEEEKAVQRKIDWRLIPLMLIVNALQLIDKNSLSQAATYGLIQQAKLQGQEYSILVALFYIGYMVAEYPTNYLMQKFPTGKYITVNFILWGITLTCMASATNFATLAVARFFLGVFEACINPGFVLITSSWWKKEDQATRIGFWYAAAGIAGIFAGLLFYAVAFIEAGGWFAYQWMFLIFGLLTTTIGISLWWLLPDSPVTASFLTERERIIAVERLRGNKTGIKNTEHKKEQIWEALTDIKIWLLTAGVFFQNMTNGLQGSFTGLIIKGFGYNTYQAVLLSMPSGAVVTVAVFTVTWLLGRKRFQNMRIFAIILCYLPGVIGTVILYSVPVSSGTQGVLLFAVFFLNIISTCAAIMYSLLASNVGGYTKKSVANTMFFIAYSVGNIVSPQAFLQREAPRYQTGIAVTLASFCGSILTFSALWVVYTRENAKRDREAINAPSESVENDEMRNAFSDMTDIQNKSLRYTK